MDDIDRAQVSSDLFLATALKKARGLPPGALSPEMCIDCGERIPEARRLAVPGCCRCIDCQEEFEWSNGPE